MKMNFTKIDILLFSALLMLFVASCSSEKSEKKEVKTTIPATVAVAKSISYPVVHSFSGKLEAEKQANLSTRLMGQIDHIFVEVGQQVKKGDLLLKIRNKDILAKKAQVAANKIEASAAFENAQKDMKRFEALYKTKSATDKEMDDVRTHFEMAKARLDAVNQMENEVEESLRYATIRAPYNGVITGKFVDEGDMANPGTPLLSMESPSQWKVIARIPEADITRLKLNDPVTVTLKASGLKVDGTIAEINPSSANTGNQFEAKVLLSVNPADAKRLYSGMYATVNYAHGTQSSVLIPKHSLIDKGQLVGLYAISQNGTALLRWVKTGKMHGDSIEILSGLSDGEKYIASCDGKLFDGALVENE